MTTQAQVTFSIQAANKVYRTPTNPFALVPGILKRGYTQWALAPDGCVALPDLPAKCHVLFDRPLGVLASPYRVSAFKGNVATSSVVPLSLHLFDRRNLEIYLLMIDALHGSGLAKERRVQVFVGAPADGDGWERCVGEVMLAQMLSDYLITVGYDTGGVANEESKAGMVFRFMESIGMPYFVEPSAPGTFVCPRILSSYERWKAEQADWSRTTNVWCMNADVEQRVKNGIEVLQAGLELTIALRSLEHKHIKRLMIAAAQPRTAA